LIRLDNLSFTYNDSDKPALRDIDLRIDDGEFVLITGPSGGGKSTLCRCLNGLVPHFYGGLISGVVEVQGMDVRQHSTKELATKVGMVFQDPENQLVATDIEREIAFGLENLGFSRELMARRIEEVLDTVGIAALRFRRLDELSGGEKQKVVIASVLAIHPEVLVLDEPTSELDPKGAEEVMSLLERLNDELGITVILTEHRLDRVIHLVDRLIIIHEGEVLDDGNPRRVLDNNQIEAAGIGIPPVIRLVQRLRSHGLNVSELPLTVKEGRIILNNTIQATKAPTFVDTKKADSNPIIRINKLWFAYPNKVTALSNVSLDIDEGEFVAIMGRNASGKTTLVKHLNGLLLPTKGKVEVNGIDTRDSSVAQLSLTVGYVFQNPNDHLFADTVDEEIAFALKNQGIDHSEIVSAVDQILAKFGLNQYRHYYPRYLSGGEKQRVALASVLVTQPKIIVLDEPTRGMEYWLKKQLMDFLNEYRKQGNTIILVTHDVETVTEYADRVILFSEGRVVVDGDRRDVLSKALLFSPQINRLAQALGKYGVADTTLTVNEMVSQLV
jgi:energy-coupling factor transport system ATP-binding protein